MGHSFWDGFLGANKHTVALALLLMFPLSPLAEGHHLPYTWENTDLQIHLGSRPMDTSSYL